MSARVFDATVRVKKEKEEKKTRKKKKTTSTATTKKMQKTAKKSSKKSGKKPRKAGKSDDAPEADALSPEEVKRIQQEHAYPDAVADDLLAEYRCLCFCDARSLLQLLWRDVPFAPFVARCFFCTQWSDREMNSVE